MVFDVVLFPGDALRNKKEESIASMIIDAHPNLAKLKQWTWHSLFDGHITVVPLHRATVDGLLAHVTLHNSLSVHIIVSPEQSLLSSQICILESHKLIKYKMNIIAINRLVNLNINLHFFFEEY